jgi:phosphomannomutase/phosphoglucomutase
MYADIEKHGGRPIMYKFGHSLIKDCMNTEKALLGGEMSGHIFFKHRWYGFDCAIYAAARLLEYLAAGRRPLRAHFAK